MNIETEWKEIAQSLESEIYNGKLHLSEISVKDFVKWFEWRTKTKPLDEGIKIDCFDVLSALDIFEEDVKKEINP